ncbi:hypothetical protein NP493_304g05027 [Ridgeia piscesae]|uniref:Hyaluronidase n=1 Tax=Ridgeia piscesae TaxID=27915 RepID=A0AAD9NWF7_RIDPI|nr:hypothetical protein NP493_304g05027 [Ridgeia piscesae]
MDVRWFASAVLLQYVTVCSGLVTDVVPFSVTWNVPTQRCRSLFGINVDVKSFGLTENPNNGWVGPFITIVYYNFGLYPYVDSNGTIINGGIPQAVNLTAHWEKVSEDIKQVIPDAGFTGLGVIDWEAWRPMWERNWDAKKVYQDLSLARVRTEHPDWGQKHVERAAKKQFENAARVFMTGTLQLARKLRPRGQWGYYHFGDCYNQKGDRHCKPGEMQLNDKSSSGLFPSAYFSCGNLTVNKNYAYGEVEETYRLRNATGSKTPIYLYTRVRYRSDTGWYAKEDLVNSIGQALKLGINGVVIWDDNLLSKTAESCSQVKGYVDSLLGPYVRDLLNVSRVYSRHGRPSMDGKRPTTRRMVASNWKRRVHCDVTATRKTRHLVQLGLHFWQRHIKMATSMIL